MNGHGGEIGLRGKMSILASWGSSNALARVEAAAIIVTCKRERGFGLNTQEKDR
jgi:hypothetical protein